MFRMPKDLNIDGKQYENFKNTFFQNTTLSCRPCSRYNFFIWMFRMTPGVSLDPPYRKPCSDRRSWYMNRGMRRESPETTLFLKKPHVKLQTHFSRYWAGFGSWKYAQMKARLILRRLAWVSPPGADSVVFLISGNRMSEIWIFWIFESRSGAEAQGYLIILACFFQREPPEIKD